MVLQLWKEFRQQNYVWHRRLGYVALAASDLPAVGKDTRNGEHEASVDYICVACDFWCMCYAAVSSAQSKFAPVYHVYTVARQQ